MYRGGEKQKKGNYEWQLCGMNNGCDKINIDFLRQRDPSRVTKSEISDSKNKITKRKRFSFVFLLSRKIDNRRRRGYVAMGVGSESSGAAAGGAGGAATGVAAVSIFSSLFLGVALLSLVSSRMSGPILWLTILP